MNFSRPSLFLAAIALTVVLAGCQSDRQGFRHDVLKKIHDQIASTCEPPGISYSKVVKDLNDVHSLPQDSIYSLNDSCKLLVDLQYAFEQIYLEPGILDYFQVRNSGDTTIATVISGKEDKVDIQSQKLLFSPQDSTIRYLELVVRKRQFLYDLDAELYIAFDEEGIYERHQQIVNIEVSGGNRYYAETLGKRDEL